jgi:hypothetical protein
MGIRLDSPPLPHRKCPLLLVVSKKGKKGKGVKMKEEEEEDRSIAVREWKKQPAAAERRGKPKEKLARLFKRNNRKWAKR